MPTVDRPGNRTPFSEVWVFIMSIMGHLIRSQDIATMWLSSSQLQTGSIFQFLILWGHIEKYWIHLLSSCHLLRIYCARLYHLTNNILTDLRGKKREQEIWKTLQKAKIMRVWKRVCPLPRGSKNYNNLKTDVFFHFAQDFQYHWWHLTKCEYIKSMLALEPYTVNSYCSWQCVL